MASKILYDQIFDNKEFILKALENQKVRKELETIKYNDEIEILGNKYQILETSLKSKVTDHFIFINSNEDIKKTIKNIFRDRLNLIFNFFILNHSLYDDYYIA
jgi:hypothetical protein